MGSSSSKSSSKAKAKAKARSSSSSVVVTDSARRKEISDEILATEKSYVESLSTCLSVYEAPLKEKAKTMMGKILKPSHISVIFSNMGEILEVHREFLSRMQDESAKDVRMMGQLLIDHAASFKLYTTYINNFNEALKTMSQCQKKSKFEAFLSAQMALEESRGLSLSAFLIMPVQRIPRYVLLYQDLLRNTQEEHADYENCLNALDNIREIADFVNEEKRIAEDLQHILSLEDSISSSPQPLVVKGRKLVQEDELVVASDKAKTFRSLLFNDSLVLCVPFSGSSISISSLLTSTKKWKVVHFVRLLDCEITDLKDRHDRQYAITLDVKRKEYTILFDSAEAKTAWTDVFYNTRARAPLRL